MVQVPTQPCPLQRSSCKGLRERTLLRKPKQKTSACQGTERERADPRKENPHLQAHREN